MRRNGRLLLIRTKEGDLKFPGGGIVEKESHEEALKREVLEEAGLEVEEVLELVGKVTERRVDKYDAKTVFEMVSWYYGCKGEGEMGSRSSAAMRQSLNSGPSGWSSERLSFETCASALIVSLTDGWKEKRK